MTQMSKIGVLGGVATGVGANLLTSLLEHAAEGGVQLAVETLDKSSLQNSFSEKLKKIPPGQGELFGFMRFRAPDDSIIKHGPISLGDGKRPADPLVSLGFSNQAAKGMGKKAISQLSPPAGTTWEGMDYYWATRTADGVEVFHVDNPTALQAEAIGAIYRQKALPILASQGDVLTKLALQTQLFDKIEDQMRDELRKSGIEAELAGIRQSMRQADALFRRAKADRMSALARAEKAKSLQNFSQVMGLASSFTNFIDVANAQAGYAASEQASAANSYNMSVNIYIETIKKNTSVDPQALPDQPEIEIPRQP